MAIHLHRGTSIMATEIGMHTPINELTTGQLKELRLQVIRLTIERKADGTRFVRAAVGDHYSRRLGMDGKPEVVAECIGFDMSKPWRSKPFGAREWGCVVEQDIVTP